MWNKIRVFNNWSHFMKFPQWADGPKLTKQQRAEGRLKFLIFTLAIEHTGRNSMRAFGEVVGLDHSTLSKYVKWGAFTEKAASQVQVRLNGKGTTPVTVEMLMNPLSIDKT